VAQHKRPAKGSAHLNTCCRLLARSQNPAAPKQCSGIEPSTFYTQALSFIFGEDFAWIPWGIEGFSAQQVWDEYVGWVSEIENVRPSLLHGCRQLLGVLPAAL
jgi:hypothetical protein